MDAIETKALALLIEVREERGGGYDGDRFDREIYSHEALCRAIKHHEAFRQEVSDAVREWFDGTVPGHFQPFIIAKPDPLVEIFMDAQHLDADAALCMALHTRAAIEARGGKITFPGDDGHE